ncbi:MAG: superfamily II DNA helicase RecQ [Pirellulaceae bacterium]|jgi:superfamily II DNA helicase RecQ
MAFHFIQIPACGCEKGEGELNAFLRSHRVLSVDRQWVPMGSNSFWAICVDYLETSVRAGAGSQGKRVDYRDILTPQQFENFAVLRELRKDMAAEEGVPVYAVFTNEQLAQIVQRQVRDRAGLKEIEGLGDAKIKKYGERVLDVIANREANIDEKGESSV